MAIPAQGLVFTWGTSTLEEIQTFEYELGLQRQERRAWLGGQLRLTGFSMTGLSATQIGRARLLDISVPVNATQKLILYRGFAYYEQCFNQAVSNGAVLFAFQFRLYSAYSQTGTIVSI